MHDAVTVAGWVFGVAGTLYGLNCARELKQWARLCRRARIAVAYNNKVRFNHSIVEFVQWAMAVEKEKAARGQVVYVYNKTSVSVIRAQNPPGRLKTHFLKRKREQAEPSKGEVKAAK